MKFPKLPLDLLSLTLLPVVWLAGLLPARAAWEEKYLSDRKNLGSEERIRILEKELAGRGFGQMKKSLFEDDADFSSVFRRLHGSQKVRVLQESLEHGEVSGSRIFHVQLQGFPADLRALLLKLETFPRALSLREFELLSDQNPAFLRLDLEYRVVK